MQYRFEQYVDNGIKVAIRNHEVASIEVSSWGAYKMNILTIADEEERRATLKHFEVYTLKAIEYGESFDCDLDVVFNSSENPYKGAMTGVLVAVPTDDGFKIALREWTDRSAGSLGMGTYTPFFGNSSYTVYPNFYKHYIGENVIFNLAGKTFPIMDEDLENRKITFYPTCNKFIEGDRVVFECSGPPWLDTRVTSDNNFEFVSDDCKNFYEFYK